METTKVKNDHRSIFSNLSNWKEAWKYQGFNRIQTCDLHDTGAMLHQMSYEATLGARSIIGFISSREEWNDVKYTWNNSYLNCSCRWKWRRIMAVNFQLKQLERRSLKKSGLQQDLNLWPPQCWCDALPTELWSHTLGARSINWIHIFSW